MSTNKGSSKSSIQLGGTNRINNISSINGGSNNTSPPSPRSPQSPRGSVASGIKSKSSINITQSHSQSSLTSTSSSPVKIQSSVSSSSFQYWKEKEAVTSPSTSPISSPQISSSKLSSNSTSSSKSQPATISSGTNSNINSASPVKKSIFSLGSKKSASSNPPNNLSTKQQQQQQQTSSQQSIESATISAGTSINKQVGSGNISNTNNTGSSTLPNRMNNRKSLKNPLNIFSLDFWSNNKNEEMGNPEEELNQPTTTTTTTNNNNNVSVSVNNNSNNSNNNVKTPPNNSPNLTSTPSKSKSTIGISGSVTPSSTQSTPANGTPKKTFISNSSPTNTSPNTTPAIPIKQNNVKLSASTKSNSLQNASLSSTLTFSTSSTSTTPSTKSPALNSQNGASSTVKPNIMAPKKVSPTLQSVNSTQQNNNNNNNNSNNIVSRSNTSTVAPSNNNNNNNNEEDSSGSTTPTNQNTPPLTGSYESSLPFDPEELNLSKLKSKIGKSDFERLVNLEFYTRVLSKDLEEVTGKLTNEISIRKDLESHTKEMETRLRIYEARLKRYSTMPNGDEITTTPPSPSSPQLQPPSISSPNTPPPLPPRSYLNLIEAEKEQLEKEEEEIIKYKEEREDSRINALLTRMETLEKKVLSLETRNRQLMEEIHILRTENELLNPDRKKTLKKLEKEKEKERERELKEREKELQKEKEREKQRQKEFLKQQKEKEKELKQQEKENTNSATAPEIDTDTDSAETNSEFETGSISESKKSSMKKSRALSNVDQTQAMQSSNSQTSLSSMIQDSPSKKNVAFTDKNKEDGNGTIKSKSSSYLSSVTLRRNTAKRMSAHFGTTTTFNDDDDDSESTTSEKVKNIFHEIYDGNIEEMKNHKITRMRSKSLSKDADDDEYLNQPSSAAKLSFSSSSTSNITGSLGLNKDNVPVSLCTSVDSNTPPSNSPTITSQQQAPTSKPDAMEKIRTLTIGRMSSKKKAGIKDAQLQLSEKLNHRASKNELVFRNIIKAESIFGIALSEDTSDKLNDYLTKSIEYLLNNSSDERVFNSDVSEVKLKQMIEQIENTLITDFSQCKEPSLIAAVFLYYFGKLPQLILSKITPQMLHSTDINHDEYRFNVVHSLLYMLPLQNRNILKMVLQFLNKYSSSTTNESIMDNIYNKFSRVLMDTTVATMDQASRSFKFLVQNYDQLENSPQDIQYMIKDGESIVKAASFDRLVEKLFDLSYGFKDPDYNYTIFHTYDYYTTSIILLEKFIHYYRISLTLTPKLQMEMSITVLSVAMFWMKIQQNQLMTDLIFLQKLKVFIDSMQQIPPSHNTYFSYFQTFFKPNLEPLKPLYERGNSFVGPNLTQSSAGKKKNHLIEKMMSKNKDNSNPDIDIYTLGAPIIAQQITLIDNEMLMAIPPTQFLHGAFTKQHLSPQYHDMVYKFNEWARWTSTEILSKEKLVDRVQCLTFFIDLGKNLVDLGNYSAANAILCGLNNSAVTRLKLTWERLTNKVSQDYDRIESLFDLSMNYKNYREEIKTTKAKIIPYLGVFTKDLIAIEEGNDTFTQSKLINMEKFRLLYGTIKRIQSYQQPLFNIKATEPIKIYLKNISQNLLDEKELHSISQRLEPRQSISN